MKMFGCRVVLLHLILLLNICSINYQPYRKTPKFSYQTLAGKNFANTNLIGTVTLIDFWAPWCAPCRQSNRELSNYYYNLDTLDREVFQLASIGLDNDSIAWQNALEQDGLTWAIQICDTNMKKSHIVKEFKATRLPYTVLLNAKGEIVSEGIQGKLLFSKIDQAIKVCQNGTSK